MRAAVCANDTVLVLLVVVVVVVASWRLPSPSPRTCPPCSSVSSCSCHGPATRKCPACRQSDRRRSLIARCKGRTSLTGSSGEEEDDEDDEEEEVEAVGGSSGLPGCMRHPSATAQGSASAGNPSATEPWDATQSTDSQSGTRPISGHVGSWEFRGCAAECRYARSLRRHMPASVARRKHRPRMDDSCRTKESPAPPDPDGIGILPPWDDIDDIDDDIDDLDDDDDAAIVASRFKARTRAWIHRAIVAAAASS